jgi:hypothetical protein
MKKTTLISTLSIALLTGIAIVFMSFTSSTKENKIIVVRTFETINAPGANISITDGIEISQKVPLDILRKNGDDNILKIATALNDIKSKGYTLVSSNSSGGDGFIITNYVFEKE